MLHDSVYFTYSSVDRHSHCLQLLTLIWWGEHLCISCYVDNLSCGYILYFQVSQVYTQTRCSGSCSISIYIFFEKLSNCFSEGWYNFRLPSVMQEGSKIFIYLPSLVFVSFYYIQANGYEVTLHCSFDLLSPK